MSTKFKGSVRVGGNLKLDQEPIERALQIDVNGEIKASNVTSTELEYLDGVISPIQTQLDSKANDADTIKKDGSVPFEADQSMGGFKLTNLATPTAGSDASTKAYVDAVAEGLKPKAAVRAATIANITISTDLNVGDVIDGVTLADGDRVLVKNQVNAEDNGIYIAGASPTRSSDFDSLTPIDEINGAYVAVQEGTSNAGKLFVQSGQVNTIGTDSINFVFFNAISGLVGGDGITVSGTNISVDHDGEGLTFAANQLALELDGATLEKSAAGLKLSDTAVTPGSFGSASETVTITVDQQGRLTAASEQAISITASQVSDFDEVAQDAVGGILTDSASVDFTYDDGLNTISAAVLPSGVDHDALSNFVANEHVDHSTVEIQTIANSGLTGGGDITTSRSLSVDINGTTVASAIDSTTDEVLIYDSSAGELRKAVIEDLQAADFISQITDTNSIDLTVSAGDLQANLRLSANGPDASNQEVDLNIELDGLRAQIPDANILAVAANKTLSNLEAPTSINQDLLPADSDKDIGSPADPFNQIHGQRIVSTDASTSEEYLAISGNEVTALGTNSLVLETEINLSGNTENITIRTGDSDSSTTGNIVLSPGSTSGTRGHIDADEALIKNLTNPIDAQDAATKFYVDNNSPTVFQDNEFKIIDQIDDTKELAFEVTAIATNTTRTISMPNADVNLADVNQSLLQDGTRAMAADLDMDSNKIINLVDPTNAQDAATKAYVDANSNSETGDIQLTVFNGANNQTTPANVTDFAFSNSTVRSFKALVSVIVDATDDLFESFDLLGIQKGSGWEMSQVATGDDSGVVFTINSSGQIQYTSENYAGFNSLEIQFRAIVTQI